MKPRQTHFYWLDLFRFIAAFAVVMCHFRGAFFVDFTSLPAAEQTTANFIFYAFTRLGNEAVLIFFVLSGFLVGGRSIEKIKEGTFTGKNYCIDRFVRIMLPLTSALLLYIPVAIWCGAELEWKSWFGCLFSLQGIWTASCIEPLWSLAYEVWFYILVIGLFLAICRGNFKKYVGFAIMIVVFLVFTKLSTHYLLMWIMGALAYVARPKSCNKFLLLGSLFCMAITIAVLQYTSGGHVTAGWTNCLPTQNRHAHELIFAFFCCFFIQQLILIVPNTNISKCINTIGTKLAAFSYTLYLVHVLILRFLEHLGAPKSESINVISVSLWFAWLGIALIVCWFLYLCFEKHTKSVKTWIKNKL